MRQADRSRIDIAQNHPADSSHCSFPGDAEATRRGGEKVEDLDARNTIVESHALTILPTIGAFAEAARTLAERGVDASAAGLVALESTLRARIGAEDCPSSEACPGHATKAHDEACRLPPDMPMAILEFHGGDPRVAVSRGHVLDRLSGAVHGGPASLAAALGASVSSRDGEAFAVAVLSGSTLIWTMTTSSEEAPAIASFLLARSVERVCTFTSPRRPGRNGSGGEP